MSLKEEELKFNTEWDYLSQTCNWVYQEIDKIVKKLDKLDEAGELTDEVFDNYKNQMLYLDRKAQQENNNLSDFEKRYSDFLKRRKIAGFLNLKNLKKFKP